MYKFAWILGISFIFTFAVLTVFRPVGVTVEQASGQLAWFFRLAGTGEIRLRVLGTVILIGLIYSSWKMIGKHLPPGQRWAGVLTVVNFPWVYILALNHLEEALSLVGLNIFLATDNQVLQITALLGMAASSTVGFIGATVLTGVKILQKQYRFSAVLLVLAGWAVWQQTGSSIWKSSEFLSQLQPSQLALTINEEQKIIYLSANRQIVMPQLVSKITYNKVNWAINLIIKRLTSVADPTMWTAPGSAWVITRLSGIPPKGVWETLYFWQVPLVIIGLVQAPFSVTGLLILFAGVIPAAIANPPDGNAAGALLVPFLILAAAKAAGRLTEKRKILAVFFIGINILGFYYFIKRVFWQTDSVQDTRVMSYQKIYQLYAGLAPKYTKFRITDRQGPTRKMLDFYTGGLPVEIEVKAFEPREVDADPDRVYIGLTKEIFPEKITPSDSGLEILGKITLPDEMVHDYGNIIWAVKRK